MKPTKPFPWDEATLDTDRCSAGVNADLTLTARLGFRHINPAGGAAAGTYNDYGDPSQTARKIVRWTSKDWATWKVNFCLSAQVFWDGRFWIDNRRGAFAVQQPKGVFAKRPAGR